MRIRPLMLCTSVFGLVVHAAQAQPTFRAGTTLLEGSAIVTKSGAPVHDLRPEEVHVFDNGVEQPLAAFEFVDLTTVEGPDRRRDFVLVVDDWHISPTRTSQAQDAARAFARALDPHDRLGFVTTGPHQAAIDLTTDHASVERAIEKLRGQHAGMPVSRHEMELRARQAFDVVRGVVAGFQGDAAERRTIVLISEGHHGLTGRGTIDDDPAALAMYRDVIRDAATANVAVYAIDPRGLQAPSAGGPGGVSSMAARRFGSLGTIAMHTGGTLTVDTNDLAADVPRIIHDSRQYYRLAYVQPDPEPRVTRPEPRRITVKVDRPGVEVRSRQAYVPRPPLGG